MKKKGHYLINLRRHNSIIFKKNAIIVAATEGLVREEQLLHDMCLLGAVTVEITQILTRAGKL